MWFCQFQSLIWHILWQVRELFLRQHSRVLLDKTWLAHIRQKGHQESFLHSLRILSCMHKSILLEEMTMHAHISKRLWNMNVLIICCTIWTGNISKNFKVNWGRTRSKLNSGWPFRDWYQWWTKDSQKIKHINFECIWYK